MSDAARMNADIIQTDEGIKIQVGTLCIELVSEPKHFGPLNPYPNNDEKDKGGSGVIFWENDYRVDKGTEVAVGEGSAIAYEEIPQSQVKNIIRAINESLKNGVDGQ